MYERCSTRNRPAIEKFMFQTLYRGASSPLRCTKPVACSLDGHAIAGGIILALNCDYISIGTRKPFLIGLTEVAVGVPFPILPLKMTMHQLDPQLAHRLVFDANCIQSTDFPIRGGRGENPDELSMKWLKMVSERPLKGFELTKKKWWGDIAQLSSVENDQEKQEYIDAITSDECLQAMKQTLKK